jgi:hypothetical protein
MKLKSDFSLSDWEKIFLRYNGNLAQVKLSLRDGWSYSDDISTEFKINADITNDFSEGLYKCYMSMVEVYGENNETMPKDALAELWYLKNIWTPFFKLLASPTIGVKVWEIHSQASAKRRNVGRTLSGHSAVGRKILTLKRLGLEIAAIEIGTGNSCDNSTKSLSDELKLCKVIKDMSDMICATTRNHELCRRGLVLFGIKISKLNVKFYSFHYVGGRYNRFQLFEDLTLLDIFDSTNITLIAISFVLLKKRMIDMEEFVYSNCPSARISFESALESKSTIGSSEIEINFAPTMTSPKLGPRGSSLKRNLSNISDMSV